MLARNILIALLGHGVSAQAQDIVSGEYWVDTDPGWGQGFPITGLPLQEEVSSHAFIIPTNALAQGIHTIGYRTKDAQGRWSHTNHGTLLVLAQEEQSPIARTVYFFNSDPGWEGGSDTGVDGAMDLSNEFTANASALPQGINTLYVRSQSENGRWSHTNHATVLVVDSSHGVVTSAESFWDVDPGFGGGYPVSGWTPGTDVLDTFDVVVPDTLQAHAYHRLYIRSRDSRGRWSHTNYRVDSIFVDLGTSVNDLPAASGISTYPNPFTEGITVRTDDGLPMRVILYDPQGKLIHDKVLTGETHIVLSGHAQGAYTAFFWKEAERIHRFTLTKQ